MTVRLIAAVSANGVIGVNGDLPWSIKDDLKIFKNLTMNRVVLMGGETYRSLPTKLEGRQMVVLSRTLPESPDYRVVRSFNEAKQLLSGEVDVIGGESLYSWAVETGLVDELILTHVNCWVNSLRGNKEARLDFRKLGNYVAIEILTEGAKSKRNEFSFKTVKYVRKK